MALFVYLHPIPVEGTATNESQNRWTKQDKAMSTLTSPKIKKYLVLKLCKEFCIYYRKNGTCKGNKTKELSKKLSHKAPVMRYFTQNRMAGWCAKMWCASSKPVHSRGPSPHRSLFWLQSCSCFTHKNTATWTAPFIIFSCKWGCHIVRYSLMPCLQYVYIA